MANEDEDFSNIDDTEAEQDEDAEDTDYATMTQSVGSPLHPSKESPGKQLEQVLRASLGNGGPEDLARRGEQVAMAMMQVTNGGEWEMKDNPKSHGPDVLGFDRRGRPHAVENKFGSAHSGCPWNQLEVRAHGNQGSQGYHKNWFKKQELSPRTDPFTQMNNRVDRARRNGKPLISNLVIVDRKKGVVERHTLNDTATGTVGMPDRAVLSRDTINWLFPPKK